MAEAWVPIDEVAKHLGVAKDSVYRWIEHKDLPAHKIGRLWKCKLSEVDAWVRAGAPRARRMLLRGRHEVLTCAPGAMATAVPAGVGALRVWDGRRRAEMKAPLLKRGAGERGFVLSEDPEMIRGYSEGGRPTVS